MALPPEARAPKPKPKPKRKKKAYTLPKTAKPEATTRTGKATPPAKRPAPKSQPGPYTNQERAKVEAHKRTPTYVAAVKVAYRKQPLAKRQQRVSQILNKISGPRRLGGRTGSRLSIEDLAILDTNIRRSRRDEKLLGSKTFTDRQRKLVEAFKGTKSYQDALLEARFPVTDKRYKELFETDRDKLKRAGFIEEGSDPLTKIVHSPAYLYGGFSSAAAVAEGAYKDPVGVPAKTLKSLPLALAGVPVAAANTVLHPAKTVKQIGESLATPYAEKVKRVRKGGALEDIGNAALVIGPTVGGPTVRLITRGGRRALKLDSGGTGRRPRTHGAVRFVVGSAIDNQKAKRYERLARKDKPLTALQHEALQRNRKAGHTVAVVPAASSFKIRRHGVAKPRGKGVQALRFTRAKGPLGRLAKQKFNLNDAEQQALWVAMEAGVHTPEAARVHLPRLIEKMVATRTREPRGHERDMDVIAQLRELEVDPEKHFTPNLRKVLAEIEKETDAISEVEPQFKKLTKEGRRRAVQAFLLDVEPGEIPEKPHISAKEVARGGVAAVPALRYTPETDEEFFARIDQTASEAGLAKPMYFKSEKQRGLQADYSAAVVGGGRATSTGRAYEGKNLGEGVFDTSYEQMLRGYAHNVKARSNYDLVIELDRTNRLKSLVPEDEGVSVGEALNRVNRAEPRIDKDSVALVNLGLFKRNMPDEPVKDLDVPDAEDAFDARLDKALSKAVIDDFDNVDPELLQTNGWQVWPKEALRELEAELTAGRAGGRVFDIVKGTLSKGILLTGNLPWLGIQFASEAAVTAIASKGRAFTPRNLAGTVKMWKAMDDRQRGEVAGAMGLGATASDLTTVKMGSSINRGFGHTWRAFKSRDFWHRPRVAGLPAATLLNPVQWFRAADQGKTNVLRLLYAHQELSRRLPPEKLEATADAMVEMSRAGKAIDALLPQFKKPPAEQLAYLKAHPELLDEVADATSNALGDWTTLTASERTWLNRFVMFYPFVRYSTRLVLYTMPVDHPAVTAVLAELGAMQAEEYREIFGSDQLPWNIGMVYFGKTGESAGIDLKRAHPGMNALFDIFTSGGDASKLLSAAPPYVQWAVDQATSGSLFADRDWRVRGKAAPYGMKAKDVDAITRLRILADDALSIMYPYRLAKEHTQEGVQGDDSLLFSERPVTFHPQGSIDELEAKFAREHATFEESKEGLGSALLGPLYPQPSDAKRQADRKAYIEKLRKQAKGGSKPKSPFKGRGKTTPFKARGKSGSPFRSR